MKPLQTKPSRTVGILMVIAIMVVLISGLAPPQDNVEDLVLNWEARIGQSDASASSINVADTHGDGGQGFVLGGFGFDSDRVW
jgi:hypothetical protein